MKFLKKSLLVIFVFTGISCLAQTGCTDYQATIYDPSAVINDGSCIYPFTSLPLTFRCDIDSIELKETSGILNLNNTYWTHVDDANNSIYRISTSSNSILQKLTISNATNIDWEDISSDANYVYIGDVGNNNGNRTDLCFYKIKKSDITPSAVAVNAGRIRFGYADQTDFTLNHNHHFFECEAFFILNDTIHLFTKGWVNRWTKHYVLPADTGVQIAQLLDSFFVSSLITSAAIQGDSLVVLLGVNYTGVNDCFLWMFNKFDHSRFFSGNKRRFDLGSPMVVGQAEGICFKGTNKCYITNERNSFGGAIFPNQLREFDLGTYLAPSPPAPVIAISANNITQNLRACSDSGSTSFTIRNYSTFAGQDLYFSIGGLPPWLSATPASDTISPGDSMVISLHAFSGTMTGGSYLRFISIHSNDPWHADKSVSFRLNISSNPCIDFTFASDTCNGKVYFNTSAINTPTFYHWNFGDGDTSDIVSPSHTYSATGNYIVSLTGCNAAGCDSVIQNVQATNTGPKASVCYPQTQSYCCGRGITHFQITGPSGDVINNNSSDANAGYEDFSCSNPGTMITDYPYSLTCTTGTNDSEFLRVWLDMNNDGFLDSLTEELFSDLDTITPDHSGTITVPSLLTSVYGVPLRMRVGSDFQQVPQPCVDPQSGQDEDYSIILNLSTVNVNEISAKEDLNIFPNPFTHSANINYTLKQSSIIRLEVFNVLGERVRVFVDSQIQSAAQYRYQFTTVCSGIYFAKLMVNDKSVVMKMVKTN